MLQNDIIEYYLNNTMSMKVESINICNSDCVFCAYSQMTRKKTILDFDLFKKMTGLLREANIKLINFSPIVGEVLLDPFFIERLRLFHENGFRVFIFSNIFCLNKYSDELLKEMADKLESIIISIAPNEVAHKMLFRKGRYDVILQGLERLHDAGRSNQCTLILQVRSFPANNDFDERFQRIVESGRFRLEIQDYKYRNWGGAIEKIAGQENNILRSGDVKKTIPCKIAQRGVVYSSGEVGFCPCSDFNATMKIGDLRCASLVEILKSSTRRTMIEGFFSNKLPLHCEQCTHYVPFDGTEY